MLNNVVAQLKAQKVVSQAFTFVDFTAVVSKLSIWRERDKILQEKSPPRLKAIKENIPGVDISGNLKECISNEELKTTNKNIAKYAEVTPANVLNHDENVLEKILPDEGMVLADRGYDTNKAEEKVKEKGLHSGIKKRKCRKNRDPDRDKWVTRLWSPFESVFRYADKVTLYKGLSKVKFHQVLDTFALNLKRLVRINGTPLFPVIKLA